MLDNLTLTSLYQIYISSFHAISPKKQFLTLNLRDLMFQSLIWKDKLFSSKIGQLKSYMLIQAKFLHPTTILKFVLCAHHSHLPATKWRHHQLTIFTEILRSKTWSTNMIISISNIRWNNRLKMKVSQMSPKKPRLDLESSIFPELVLQSPTKLPLWTWLSLKRKKAQTKVKHLRKLFRKQSWKLPPNQFQKLLEKSSLAPKCWRN